jgi:dihydroxyacetone kinase-like predicted kinase
VLLLAALLELATGDVPDLPEEIFEGAPDLSGRAHERTGEHSVADLRYEVMFLLDGGTAAGDRLRDAWEGLGDSIVVVGGEGTWNCHIHTDEIGPAIEAGITLGRPHRIAVTDLLEQAEEERFHAAVDFDPLPEVRHAKVGLVAVAVGAGVVEFFRQHGAQGVVVGGQTMNPSVGDLLEVVEAVPAKTVAVLPNNKNVIPAAEELDKLTKKTVHVIPTRSVPQGIAAAVSYVSSVPAERLIPAMTRAAEDVRSGELTRAVRDARTPAGSIREGDWLGLVDGTVAVIERGPGRVSSLVSRVVGRLGGAEREQRRTGARERDGLLAALIALLEATLSDESEVVTVVTGSDADPDVTTAARAWLSDHHPAIDFEETDGAQPLYPYLLGVE